MSHTFSLSQVHLELGLLREQRDIIDDEVQRYEWALKQVRWTDLGKEQMMEKGAGWIGGPEGALMDRGVEGRSDGYIGGLTNSCDGSIMRNRYGLGVKQGAFREGWYSFGSEGTLSRG